MTTDDENRETATVATKASKNDETTRRVREAIVARVTKRLEALDIAPQRACLDAGIGRDVIRDWRRKDGTLVMPRIDSLALLAGPLKTSLRWLLIGDGPEEVGGEPLAADELLSRTIPVVGFVQAGLWAESIEWDDGAQYVVSIPNDAALRGATLYGLEVRGNSMDEVYPPGTIVIVERNAFDAYNVENGCRYHVERQRPDGSVESTLKRMVKTSDGRHFLVPESRDPSFDKIDMTASKADESYSIVGKVVFSVRREV